jgi:hypothetical protein
MALVRSLWHILRSTVTSRDHAVDRWSAIPLGALVRYVVITWKIQRCVTSLTLPSPACRDGMREQTPSSSDGPNNLATGEAINRRECNITLAASITDDLATVVKNGCSFVAEAPFAGRRAMAYHRFRQT